MARTDARTTQVCAMNEQITCCVTSWNARYALSAMWESYCLRNPEWPAKLFVLDNGSTDGALEYAVWHADLVLRANNTRNHGVCLTEMGRRVQTEFLLVTDNDILWTLPGGMDLMMERLKPDTWCVCPSRHDGSRPDFIDTRRMILYSPNICVGLFRTETFQRICRELDLGYAGDFTTGGVWETGGLAWHVARTHGLDSVELAEMWRYVDHYGNVSQIWQHIPNYPSLEGMNPTLGDVARDSYLDRYERVKCDLAKIRGCSVQDLDAHEPFTGRQAVMETLPWERIETYHPFLVSGAGVR